MSQFLTTGKHNPISAGALAIGINPEIKATHPDLAHTFAGIAISLPLQSDKSKGSG